MLYPAMYCPLNFVTGISCNLGLDLDDQVISVCWLQGCRCSSISGVSLHFLKNITLTEVSAIFKIYLCRKIGCIKCICYIAISSVKIFLISFINMLIYFLP